MCFRVNIKRGGIACCFCVFQSQHSKRWHCILFLVSFSVGIQSCIIARCFCVFQSRLTFKEVSLYTVFYVFQSQHSKKCHCILFLCFSVYIQRSVITYCFCVFQRQQSKRCHCILFLCVSESTSEEVSLHTVNTQGFVWKFFMRYI